jgi:hypothetical protein
MIYYLGILSLNRIRESKSLPKITHKASKTPSISRPSQNHLEAKIRSKYTLDRPGLKKHNIINKPVRKHKNSSIHSKMPSLTFSSSPKSALKKSHPPLKASGKPPKMTKSSKIQ